MNDKYSEFSTDTTNQKNGQFHIAFAWLAALSASIAAWASLS
jgi:hypothetical protein